MDAGIPMLVANGDKQGILYDIVDSKPVGTLFRTGGCRTMTKTRIRYLIASLIGIAVGSFSASGLSAWLAVLTPDAGPLFPRAPQRI